MIPPGHTPLHTLFSRLAEAEARSGNVIRAASVAAGRLQQLLVSCALQAFRCDAAGGAVAIPAAEWPTDSADFRREIMRLGYVDAFVEDQAAGTLFAPPGPDPAANVETRGAKPFDTARLCAAVAVAAFHGGRKPTQKATIEGIQQAYDRLYGADTAPERTTLQPIANAIMTAFEKEGVSAEK